MIAAITTSITIMIIIVRSDLVFGFEIQLIHMNNRPHTHALKAQNDIGKEDA